VPMGGKSLHLTRRTNFFRDGRTSHGDEYPMRTHSRLHDLPACHRHVRALAGRTTVTSVSAV